LQQEKDEVINELKEQLADLKKKHEDLTIKFNLNRRESMLN